MLTIREKTNLKAFNTFGIEVYCDHFCEIYSVEEFIELTQLPVYNSQKLIIGGGSNLLFTKDFRGLVIKNSIRGISIEGETADHVLIRAGAGEVWHEFVTYCIDHGFAGIENLSLIPGCVGASPMQNIGAYGVEIKEVFESLEAYSLDRAKKRIFTKGECEFGYRESVFKNKEKDKYLITAVTFRLSKHPAVNTTYGAISQELSAMNVDIPGIRDVSNAVINIRKSKLPDPREFGNAGSFFKNPEVSGERYHALKSKHGDMVAYPLTNGNYKLAAGWLIEHCGMKGFEHKGAAVHTKQALVLINKENCTGKAVYELSELVIKRVMERFGVSLEREVNIIQ